MRQVSKGDMISNVNPTVLYYQTLLKNYNQTDKLSEGFTDAKISYSSHQEQMCAFKTKQRM